MKLRVDVDARAELREAARWYESQRVGLGAEFVAEITDGLRHIRKAPLQFARLETLPKERAIRRYRLRRFPFAIIYEAGEDEIHVVAVAHSSRRPGYWKYRR